MSPFVKLHRTVKPILLSILIGSTVTLFQACPNEDPSLGFPKEVVDTKYGDIKGYEEDDLFIYKGIPFAKPPIGNLRWKPPVEPNPWNAVRDATEYSASCMQPSVDLIPDDVEPQLKNEDCLYLNIFSHKNKRNLPVMVWFHGGGYTIGSGTSQSYDGRNLLGEQEVVLVTTNYRLGPLGFMPHELLNQESANGVSGNYGMLDQVQALKWVKNNIKNFGGDPNNVTIFGQSAGGGSVCYHLLSPLSQGLFHRAIIHSYNCAGDVRDLSEGSRRKLSGIELGAKAQSELGCDGTTTNPLECMRSATAEDVIDKIRIKFSFLDNSDGELYWPVVDNYFLPGQPKDLIDAGQFNKVPIIGGTTYDETSLYRSLLNWVNTVGRLKLGFGLLLPGHVDELFAEYPAITDAQAQLQFERFLTDYLFICPTTQYLKGFAAHSEDVWQYSFEKVHPSGRDSLIGSYHGSDIFYALNNLNPFQNFADEDFDFWDYNTATLMGTYWTQFAANGDPGAIDGIHNSSWQRLDSQSESYLKFSRTEDDFGLHIGLRKDKCDFLNSLE